ncbi:MAG: hotdog fold thioesterase [Salibacteraceae bacterium]|jgi:1,4-dihydroxy-2-naphthoyl-CoA hydrolase|nr:hotdog fold thioesterase [Salibacteraceae bacterium]MDP4934858.1 hotdog fold thioesterase [Salibacteraceae bacterium]
MIWFKPVDITQASQGSKNTLLETLDIQITEIGDDFLKGTMPVDHRTVQPYGILHGGASVSLAESLGSVAAYLTVDPEIYVTVGQEVNANHIRPVTSGRVTGIAKPVHIGRTSQVWSIEITNEAGKLVCISRLTMAVVEKSKLKP